MILNQDLVVVKSFKSKWAWLTSNSLYEVFFVVALIAFGGIIFYAIEAPDQVENEEALSSFLEEIYHTDPHTYITVTGSPPIGITKDWAGTRSSLFAFTIASTIGYGNHGPETETGRWFLICFAIFSIPTAGICFGAFCTRVMEALGNLVALVVSSRMAEALDRRRTMQLIKCPWSNPDEVPMAAEDLEPVLRSLGVGVDAEWLIRQMDTDGDNALSVKEFRAKMLKFQNVVAAELLVKSSVKIAGVSFLALCVLGGLVFSTLEGDWDLRMSFYFCRGYPQYRGIRRACALHPAL